ncbi:EAL domain-containing protein [Vibrio splendidus]|nr:EAL domain-containing protein [Vibrio splendidus]MCC4882979.1 EAL domain-containing protein [Vibrio splendidus]
MNQYYGDYKRYYQPIFNSSNDSIHHYEMLIRKKDGSSAFQEIIELEKEGKIHEIDLSNLMFAVSEVNKGRVAHPIAINISSDSLGRNGFFEDMANVLRTCKNRQLISLELTETGNMPDIPQFRGFFQILQDEGIKISADDFSCGFMNESIISSLPFDNIKIDKLLIHGMMTDKSMEDRVSKLVEYARHNDISITAEFVDNIEIYNKVKEMGIDFIQGYYLGIPAPSMIQEKDRHTTCSM